MRVTGAVLVMGLLTGAAWSDEVPVETGRLGKQEITLHVHPFLLADELDVLRKVLVNKDVLAVLVPAKGGYAALSVSPDDGFIRDGVPVESAVALAQLPDAETARTETLKACDAARKGRADCVVVLEIAPRK